MRTRPARRRTAALALAALVALAAFTAGAAFAADEANAALDMFLDLGPVKGE